MSHSFFVDFLALLTSRGLAQFVTIAVGLILVRLMADSEFGAYSLATTTIGLAGIFADLGLDPVITRMLSRDPEHLPGLVTRTSGMRVIAALGVTVCLVLGASANLPIGRPDLILIGGLGLAPRGLMRALLAAQVGLNRVRDSAWGEGAATLATSALTLTAVVVLPAGKAIGAMLALSVGQLVGLLVTYRLWQVRIPIADRSPANLMSVEARTLLRQAVPFLVMGLVGTLFQSLDIYIVRQFYWTPGSPDTVALYAAPFRILNALLLVPTAWGTAALPRYVRAMMAGNSLQSMVRHDLRINFAIGLSLGAGCTLLAEPLTVLALGPAYRQSAPILAILGWMTLPVCLSAPYIAQLTATDHQIHIVRSVILAGVLATIANIGLATLATPTLLNVAGVKVAAMIGLLWLYRFGVKKP